MPQINTVGAATGLAQTAQQPTQELGEQEFLNLLMTQLGNQDPLNPMQSAEFADQISSMNQVKQLMGANERLDQLMMGMTSMNNQSAVQLVGKDVVASGSTFEHAGGEVHDLQFELAEPADRVTVTVRDAEGRVVKTIDSFDREGGMQSIAWNGTDDALQAGAAGTMTFEVNAEDGDGNPIAVDTYVRGIVEELRFDQGFPMLVIGGAEVRLDQILRVFEGEDAPPPIAPAADESASAPTVSAVALGDYPELQLQT